MAGSRRSSLLLLLGLCAVRLAAAGAWAQPFQCNSFWAPQKQEATQRAADQYTGLIFDYATAKAWHIKQQLQRPAIPLNLDAFYEADNCLKPVGVLLACAENGWRHAKCQCQVRRSSCSSITSVPIYLTAPASVPCMHDAKMLLPRPGMRPSCPEPIDLNPALQVSPVAYVSHLQGGLGGQ